MLRFARVVIISITLSLAGSAGAGGVVYDFSWQGAPSFSATGTLVLDASVGVGEPFVTGDVLSFDLELFDGGSPVGSDSFPPFEGFDTVDGIRGPTTLEVNDLIVSDDILLGCNVGDCLSGEVVFQSFGTVIDYGSRAAAQQSFVFTEVPAPGTGLLVVAALATVAALGRRA